SSLTQEVGYVQRRLQTTPASLLMLQKEKIPETTRSSFKTKLERTQLLLKSKL
ncbi:hypothetical protein M9458_009539, partial [Cirrhinus mrigala]